LSVLLCIDIGNTNTVLATFEGEKLAHSWRAKTDAGATADELGLLYRGLLATDAVSVTGIAACSTVPAALRSLRTMLTRYYPGIPTVIVEPGVRTGVPVLMDNPREVGADRIINALAAAHDFGGPAIVVDFGGTATTFDVVSESGQYIGGAIAPGIEISLEALGRRGAQLRKVELMRPRSVIAKNTVEALQSGMLFGVAAQVDGMVSRMIAELGVEVTAVNVISTGHLAPLVREECSCFTAHSPWLTLQGLRLVFERNS
jgi:type III pantothenate kinase